MTLTQLEVFAVVAARQGFTAAAAQLKISQSGVSHAIGALEKELGVTLLRRQQGAVTLTDAGQILLSRAQAMLGLAETMRQEAADARGMKRGTLRIGSFGPTSSLRLLPPVLAAYRAQYPGIEIHIDEGPDRQVIQWLHDRRIDTGFVVLPEDTFDTYSLLEDHMVALLPSDHSLSSQRTVALSDLCVDPFILTEAGSAELVTRLFLAARLQPDIRYRTSQLLTTLTTVARGDAVSIVAESALPPTPIGTYVTRPLTPGITRQVGLAVLDERNISPATRAFIALVTKMLKPRSQRR